MKKMKSEKDIIKFIGDYGITYNHYCNLYLIDTFYGSTINNLSKYNKLQEYIVLIECETEIFSFARIINSKISLDKDLMYDTWYNQNGTIIHAEKMDYNNSIDKWNNYVHNITLKNDNLELLRNKL
jgi:hypothetical protein